MPIAVDNYTLAENMAVFDYLDDTSSVRKRKKLCVHCAKVWQVRITSNTETHGVKH